MNKTENSMVAALKASAASKTEAVDAAQAKVLALKERAVRDASVADFIRDGADTELGLPAPTVSRKRKQLSLLSTRIPADLFDRAKRAVFENSRSDLEPATMQALVTRAVAVELKRLGY